MTKARKKVTVTACTHLAHGLPPAVASSRDPQSHRSLYYSINAHDTHSKINHRSEDEHHTVGTCFTVISRHLILRALIRETVMCLLSGVDCANLRQMSMCVQSTYGDSVVWAYFKCLFVVVKFNVLQKAIMLWKRL